MQHDESIDHGSGFDWGNASEEYAKYRDIYPEEFYRRIVERGLCISGQRVLDLGTGTGVLPRNMYRFGAEWTGVDISDRQTGQAKRMAAERNMAIRFFTAPAERTGLPDGAFDVVTACQCFFYFDQAKVLPEIARVLHPRGRLLILYMTWLPFESEIARGSENLVLKYNPLWTGAGFQRYQPEKAALSNPFFECIGCEAFSLALPFTRESWQGRIIACRGVGASSLPPEQIEAFKREHEAYLQTAPETFSIPHFITMLDFRRRNR